MITADSRKLGETCSSDGETPDIPSFVQRPQARVMRICEGHIATRCTEVRPGLRRPQLVASVTRGPDCDDTEYLVARHRRYKRLSRPMNYLTIQLSAPVDSEASSEPLAVVTQVFETFELVENILFQLSRKDLNTCKRVNSYIGSVIKRSYALRAHHYGPFPAHHTMTWSKEGAGSVKCRTGPISLRAAAYRHNLYGYKQPHTVIPVALNDAIFDLRSDKRLHRLHRDYARSFFPNANMTDDEALSLVIHQRMQYPRKGFTVAIDNGMHGVLDMAFTDPPVSHLEAVLYDPDSVRGDNAHPVGFLWTSHENYRRVVVHCSKGIRVRHVVAAVLEELDEKWVKQLWQPGAKYTVLDKKTIIVSKEMMDFVKKKSIVDHPGQRLRRRNCEATYGDLAHIPESN